MNDTAERILDTAQLLVQQRGFNAFSFRDLTKTLEITNAGIHYHFPTKVSLGKALVTRYTRHFMDALSGVDQASSRSQDRIRGFVKIYSDALKSNRFCLCGMMAADALTLPEEIHDAVQVFFDTTSKWLMEVLAEGKGKGEFEFEGSASTEAEAMLAGIEGAMLVSWPLMSSDPVRAAKKFESITSNFVDKLLT